jgi:uncharacterized protein YceK
MKKILLATIVSLILSGCSALDVVKSALGDGPSVSLDAQVGKDNTQQEAAIATQGDEDTITGNVEKEKTITGVAVSAATITPEGDKDVITGNVDKRAETTGIAVSALDVKQTKETKTEVIVNDNAQVEVANTEKKTDFVVGDNATIEVKDSTTNIPWWVLTILVLGWVLPTPVTMWESFWEWRDKRRLQRRLFK